MGDSNRVTTRNGVVTPIQEPLSTITAPELDKMDLEPPFFVVEDIVPQGLIILASPPKYGKSWGCLDMAISAASGTPFWGKKTNQCGTLYLALEDSEYRLQDRMRKVLNGRRPPEKFSVTIHAVDLGHGLINQLSGYVAEHPDTKLIIIDTFQKIRRAGRGGQNVYGVDYEETGELKAFADTNKIALVLVTHLRKMRDTSDDFMNITGSSAITGAADTMIVMSRENRFSEETKISITGRDMDGGELLATFDKTTFRWKILGTAEECEEREAQDNYNNNPIVLTVKKLLQHNADGWSGTASEIISSSRYFHTEIHETAQGLGKSIAKLQALLYNNDRICYQSISNGNAGKKHKFWYKGQMEV